MRLGTKTILFGVHCLPVHAFFMALAWLKLYGLRKEFFDPRLHLSFLIHDIGYWGSKSLDGDDGRLHPILGAEIMGFLFGYDWWLFNITHSGSMLEILNKDGKDYKPSKLYAADKLASPLYPKWLYKFLSNLSGEWREYCMGQFGEIRSFDEWHSTAMKHMKERAYKEINK